VELELAFLHAELEHVEGRAGVRAVGELDAAGAAVGDHAPLADPEPDPLLRDLAVKAAAGPLEVRVPQAAGQALIDPHEALRSQRGDQLGLERPIPEHEPCQQAHGREPGARR